MQPTELQLSAWTHTVLADLTREAAQAGATIVPSWWLIGPTLADGTLRSDDDTAIRDLDAWRNVFGTAGTLDTITFTQDGMMRREWRVSVVVSDVSIRLAAIVPITMETRPHNAPDPYAAGFDRFLAVAA